MSFSRPSRLTGLKLKKSDHLARDISSTRTSILRYSRNARRIRALQAGQIIAAPDVIDMKTTSQGFKRLMWELAKNTGVVSDDAITKTLDFCLAAKDLIITWFNTVFEQVSRVLSGVKDAIIRWSVTIQKCAEAVIISCGKNILKLKAFFSVLSKVGCPTDYLVEEALDQVEECFADEEAHVRLQKADRLLDDLLADYYTEKQTDEHPWYERWPDRALSVLMGLVTSITGLCEGIIDCTTGSRAGSIAAMMTKCASAYSAVSRIDFIGTGKFLFNMVYFWFTGQNYFILYDLESQFATLYKELQKECSALEGLKNPPIQRQRHVGNLLQKFKAVYPALIEVAPDRLTVYKEQYNVITTMSAPYATVVGAQRMKPVVCAIKGPAGCGKTKTLQAAADGAVMDLVLQYFDPADVGDDMPIFREHAKESSSFTLNCVGEKIPFADGYRHQLFVLFNELNTAKSPTAKSEWMNTFMQYIDDSPLLLNTAFADKGKVYLNSPFIFASGNYTEHFCPFEDANALYRRIELDLTARRINTSTTFNVKTDVLYTFNPQCILMIRDPALSPSKFLHTLYTQGFDFNSSFQYRILIHLLAGIYIERITFDVVANKSDNNVELVEGQNPKRFRSLATTFADRLEITPNFSPKHDKPTPKIHDFTPKTDSQASLNKGAMAMAALAESLFGLPVGVIPHERNRALELLRDCYPLFCSTIFDICTQAKFEPTHAWEDWNKLHLDTGTGFDIKFTIALCCADKKQTLEQFVLALKPHYEAYRLSVDSVYRAEAQQRLPGLFETLLEHTDFKICLPEIAKLKCLFETKNRMLLSCYETFDQQIPAKLALYEKYKDCSQFYDLYQFNKTLNAELLALDKETQTELYYLAKDEVAWCTDLELTRVRQGDEHYRTIESRNRDPHGYERHKRDRNYAHTKMGLQRNPDSPFAKIMYEKQKRKQDKRQETKDQTEEVALWKMHYAEQREHELMAREERDERLRREKEKLSRSKGKGKEKKRAVLIEDDDTYDCNDTQASMSFDSLEKQSGNGKDKDKAFVDNIGERDIELRDRFGLDMAKITLLAEGRALGSYSEPLGKFTVPKISCDVANIYNASSAIWKAYFNHKFQAKEGLDRAPFNVDDLCKQFDYEVSPWLMYQQMLIMIKSFQVVLQTWPADPRSMERCQWRILTWYMARLARISYYTVFLCVEWRTHYGKQIDQYPLPDSLVRVWPKLKRYSRNCLITEARVIFQKKIVEFRDTPRIVQWSGNDKVKYHVRVKANEKRNNTQPPRPRETRIIDREELQVNKKHNGDPRKKGNDAAQAKKRDQAKRLARQRGTEDKFDTRTRKQGGEDVFQRLDSMVHTFTQQYYDSNISDPDAALKPQTIFKPSYTRALLTYSGRACQLIQTMVGSQITNHRLQLADLISLWRSELGDEYALRLKCLVMVSTMLDKHTDWTNHLTRFIISLYSEVNLGKQLYQQFVAFIHLEHETCDFNDYYKSYSNARAGCVSPTKHSVYDVKILASVLNRHIVGGITEAERAYLFAMTPAPQPYTTDEILTMIAIGMAVGSLVALFCYIMALVAAWSNVETPEKHDVTQDEIRALQEQLNARGYDLKITDLEPQGSIDPKAVEYKKPRNFVEGFNKKHGTKVQAQSGLLDEAIIDKIYRNSYLVINKYGTVAGTATFVGGTVCHMNSHVWESVESIKLIPYVLGKRSILEFPKSACSVIKDYHDKDVIFLNMPLVSPHPRLHAHYVEEKLFDHIPVVTTAVVLAYDDQKYAPGIDPISQVKIEAKPKKVAELNSVGLKRGETPLEVTSWCTTKWLRARPGACGTLYYGVFQGQMKMFAQHAAGSTDGIAVGVLITKEMVEKACPAPNNITPAQKSYGSLVSLEDDDPVHNMYELTPHGYRTHISTRATDTTAMVRTPFHRYRFNGASPKEPAVLNMEAYELALAKEKATVDQIHRAHPEVLRVVQEHAETIVDKFIPFHSTTWTGCRTLTVREAIGTYGNLTPFAKQTSKGMRLRDWKMSKTKLLEGDPPTVDEFERRVMKMVNHFYETGEMAYQMNFDKMKDELRDLERVNAKKTRIFNVTDFVDNVLIKMAIGDLVDKIKDAFPTGVSACGINPASGVWAMIYNKFLFLKVLCADVSGFDHTSTSVLLYVYENLAKRAYPCPKARAFFMWAMIACIHALRFNMTYARLNGCGNSSGNWATTFKNTLDNLIYFCVVAAILVGDETKEKQMIEELLIKLYSDDNLSAYVQGYAHYNPKAVCEAFKKYLGITITSTSKGELSDKAFKIDDCDFLSRGFRYERGYVFCPLSEESLLAQLYYVRMPKAMRGDTAYLNHQVQINLGNVERELLEYDREDALRIAQKITWFISYYELPYSFAPQLYLEPDEYKSAQV